MPANKPYGCGMGPALEVVGGKWKAVILCELLSQSRRFGELKRLLSGISEKMLIQQLRELESDGLVDRVAFPEVPPRVEYSATPLGISLIEAMAPLADWGERYEVQRAQTRARSSDS